MNILLAVIGLGVFCLLLEITNFRKGIIPLTIIGLLSVLALVAYNFNTVQSSYNDMIVQDPFSMGFSGLFVLLTLLLIVLSGEYYKEKSSKISDFISIKIFLLAGSIAMVMFGNLAMFFLGIEVLSIALYILAASDRLNIKSNESGMKYFLMGSFASGILLFGICLIYGATGTFNLKEIHELSMSARIPDWFYIGLGMMATGMLFKIAAAPFHFWAPDVYEGAPAITTATMSTLSKVVAAATFYKLTTSLTSGLMANMSTILAIAAAASMIVGNFMALKQENVKRMLAFSGISHAGYMIMIILAAQPADGLLLYYTAAYALAGLGAFAVILFVSENHANEGISSFNGLSKNNPLMAFLLTCALLSMAGIPIMAGFFAKLMVFNAALENGYLALVLIAVINSIVSIGYYFKIILAMYTKQPEKTAVKVPFAYQVVAVVTILLNLLMGIFPSWMLELLG